MLLLKNFSLYEPWEISLVKVSFNLEVHSFINDFLLIFSMILDKDFNGIIEELHAADERRELLIQLSRDIIRESKVVIYSLQRGEKTSLEKIESLIEQLERESATGIENTAVQEYVEAACFYYFIHEKRIPNKEELKVDTENYLMGLCDLTGELLRKAVKDVIQKNYGGAREITALVEEIYGKFLLLDLRNGTLRQKSDSIKWNLQKLEQLLLDISGK